MSSKATALLLILDGWGHREETDSNAIAAAHTPTWDKLWREQPTTLIDTSGKSVGLPAGQMGNSEVGHMNLGAGRVVYQSLTRIDKAIEDGAFFQNEVLCTAIDKAVNNETAVHVMGLMSPGGIHSHEDQIMAALELANQRGAKRVYLHAFLDGRDTPPRSALPSLQRAEDYLVDNELGRVASLCGRFYAMDRDNRWERVEKGYRAIAEARPVTSLTPKAYIDESYAKNATDEFIEPVVFSGYDGMEEDDVVLVTNFRSDRVREITAALGDEHFDEFACKATPLNIATMTKYDASFPYPILFPKETPQNTLAEVISSAGLRQLHTAETEKYAHVTYFFNGGKGECYPGEERILIDSPKVSTYDEKPEMSAEEVADTVIESIKCEKYGFIVVNFANGDMVGHTAVRDSVIKAVEALAFNSTVLVAL